MGKKLTLISLGCDKNLMDSELMLGLLKENGYELITDKTKSEIIIINTCGFILDAASEAVIEISEAVELKNSGVCELIIVTGCLVQRYENDIFDEFPEVDAIVGTTAFDKIIDVINEAYDNSEGGLSLIEDMNRAIDEKLWEKRIVSTPKHYAYMKIAEGCDNRCTYCTIPKIRGKYRSRPLESLVSEAKNLVQNGIKELILVAQDTSLYGIDLYKTPSLHILLRELSKIEKLQRIRILYCYPEHINDELIAEMRDNEKVCHYIDMPIQHCQDSVLKKMNRKSSYDELIEIILKLRREISDIVLRTTIIVGFPGETKEDFESLLEFVTKMKFDKLGVFAYSKEEGTPAYDLPNQVNENQKISRKNRLMKLQKKISTEKMETNIGKTFNVIVDECFENDNCFGRSYMDCPGIDGGIFFKTDSPLKPGDSVFVKITKAAEYDLLGEIADGHEFAK